MRKKRFLLGVVALTAALAATGCSSTPNGSQATDSAKDQADIDKDSGSRDSDSEDTSKAAGADRNTPCTLTLATRDVATAKTSEGLDMEGRFQELYPNVEIDIGEFNTKPEYSNSMKIRSSASELPDLVFHKSDSMNQYSEYLADLTDTEANKNNQIAPEYATGGKALGVPNRKASDYVYYRTDMFDEAGIEVPEIRDEFVEASEKLQEHLGPQDPDFSAICMDAKDTRPTYPLMKYGSAAQSGNGYYQDAMATEDASSVEDMNIHTAYDEIYDLFQKDVPGKDPLGTTCGQSRVLFVKKKGAMTLSSPMFFTAYRADGYDTAGMPTSYLSSRDNNQDEPNLVTQGDCFLTVTNSSENPKVTKVFLEFYFSEA